VNEKKAASLSVIIPAYNEENHIAGTLQTIATFLTERGDRFEIIVVDDGSSDQTPQVARTDAPVGCRVIRLLRNRGKGAAVRTGVLASRGDRVLLCDADLATPITDLERLEPGLEKASIVIGSRAVEGSDVTRPQGAGRRSMGKSLNRMLHMMGVSEEFQDTQCGFKLLDGELARMMFRQMEIDRFAFDIELLMLAKTLEVKVLEVGVHWEDQPFSSVRPIRDSTRTLLDILRVRWRNRSLRPPR
jgi:dolichyl-phosphate beta-glucosyltransferase